MLTQKFNLCAILLCTILAFGKTGLACAQTQAAANSPQQTAVKVTTDDVPGLKVDIHLPSKAAVEQAKLVAAKTWEIGSRLYAAKLPPKPMKASLYRDTESYHEVDERLTNGAFRRNLAFAHFDSLSAHVALQPYLTDEGLDDVGLPVLSAQLLAHEIAHLIRFHAMPNTFRDHPDWLINGVASWIDRQVVKELGMAAANDAHDPKTCASFSRAKKLIESKKFPSVTKILDDDINGFQFYQKYDICAAFVGMLMKNYPEKMRKYLASVKRIGGGSGYAKRSGDYLLQTLEVNANTLNKEFSKHLTKVNPQWNEEYRSLETVGDSWVQIACPKFNANAWRTTTLPATFSITGKATIHRGTKQQFNIRLGHATAFTQFSITAGFGINVFRFGDKKWATVAEKRVGIIKVGQPVEFEIEHDGETIAVTVDGDEVYRGKLSLPKDAQMGLGAQNGSVIEWKKIKVTK